MNLSHALLAGLALLVPSREIGKVAQLSHGRVGAYAQVLGGPLVVDFHSDEHYPMQSVYKLPIAMAVLHKVDAGGLRLDQMVEVKPEEYISPGQGSPLRDQNPTGARVSVSELLRLAISESDGTASDVLMRLIGGPPAVMNFLAEIGVHDVEVQDTEMRMGKDDSVQYRNWATPHAAVDLLQALAESKGLSQESQHLLLGWMVSAQTSQKRIKGMLPAGTVVAHKTGSSGTKNGIAAATNDIGLIDLPDGKRLAIAVFVSDSKADTVTREKVIAQISDIAFRQVSVR